MRLSNVGFLSILKSSPVVDLISSLLGYWNTDGGTQDSEADLVGGVGTLVEMDDGSNFVGSGYGGLGTHYYRTFASSSGESLTVHTANGGTFPLTLNVWIKIDSNGVNGGIPISYGEATTWGPPVNFYSYSGNLYLVFTDTDSVIVSGTLPSDYADASWHMWTIIVDATNMPKVYIDGVLQSISWSGGPFTGTGFFHDCISFGHALYNDGLNTGDEFAGGIGLIGIWNRALNSTEISALYNAGVGLSYSEL
jgi:hypothetical protein